MFEGVVIGFGGGVVVSVLLIAAIRLQSRTITERENERLRIALAIEQSASREWEWQYRNECEQHASSVTDAIEDHAELSDHYDLALQALEASGLMAEEVSR